MTSIVLAALLGIAIFPLVLVFGPWYFPWALLVLACAGGVAGLALAPANWRLHLLQALGLAALMVAVVLGVLTLTSNLVVHRPEEVVAALSWSAVLTVPIALGAFAAARLRAALGVSRASMTGAVVALVIAVAGVGLAFALAPAEVADAPTCAASDFECPRNLCSNMAERRRLLAIERVTAFDGQNITCTYTAWGGIRIGQADVGRRGGSWTEGAWPRILSGRGP